MLRTRFTEMFAITHPVIVAATVIGDVGDVSRFESRDHFAAYNGTAPIEVSSGPRKIHRASRRGNRRLNHAIHMVAITQIRFPHTDGRAYYDRKIAEGKTGKEALRALKRRISDALYARLQQDAKRAGASEAGPGGQPGNDSDASRGRLTPRTPALRPSHSRTRRNPTTDRHPGPFQEAEGTLAKRPKSLLTAKRPRSGRSGQPVDVMRSSSGS